MSDTEPDTVPTYVVGIAIATAIVAIFASVVVVWLLVGRDLTGGGESRIVERSNVPPSDPFTTFTAKEGRRQAQREALDRWEWADAAHTRVRMPIARAIDRAVTR